MALSIGGQFNGSSGLVEAIAAFPVAPVLGSPVLATNQFRFLLPTGSGSVYQVRFLPALSTSSLWETVQTVTGDGTAIEVTMAAPTRAGFYRVVLAF